ncbi:hypothetical protein JB92DRAFT_772289 [Gautieria morchelliformis]|nr:hypothetical protein JB92DRAFT_772289 [Gautieria morchelliformis]
MRCATGVAPEGILEPIGRASRVGCTSPIAHLSRCRFSGLSGRLDARSAVVVASAMGVRCACYERLLGHRCPSPHSALRRVDGGDGAGTTSALSLSSSSTRILGGAFVLSAPRVRRGHFRSVLAMRIRAGADCGGQEARRLRRCHRSACAPNHRPSGPCLRLAYVASVAGFRHGSHERIVGMATQQLLVESRNTAFLAVEYQLQTLGKSYALLLARIPSHASTISHAASLDNEGQLTATTSRNELYSKDNDDATHYPSKTSNSPQ